LHNNLTTEGKSIVSSLSIMFFKQRWKSIKFNFKYTDGRVMDKTHFCFFDWDTACRILADTNWVVIERIDGIYLPLSFIRKFLYPLEPILN
jgi:hypothetical protein